MSKERIELSRMPCYAGKWEATVMPWTLHGAYKDEPVDEFLYLDFVEGCGSTVFELTPDEAEKLAGMLMNGAKQARQAAETERKARL